MPTHFSGTMDGNDTITPTIEYQELPDDIWDFCYNASNTNVSTISEGPVFWVEGIGISVTSIIGILGNAVTIIVLNRISLNNVFNQVRFLRISKIPEIPVQKCTKTAVTKNSCSEIMKLLKISEWPREFSQNIEMDVNVFHQSDLIDLAMSTISSKSEKPQLYI